MFSKGNEGYETFREFIKHLKGLERTEKFLIGLGRSSKVLKGTEKY